MWQTSRYRRTTRAGALRVRNSSDRLIGYLLLGVIFGAVGALIGSESEEPGRSAAAGAYLGLALAFAVYLEFRRPF